MKAVPHAFTDLARDELDSALGRIFAIHPETALNLLRDVEETITLLADGILDGRPATLVTGEAVRRVVVRTLIIYYRREEDFLRVLYVHDGRREPIERIR